MFYGELENLSQNHQMLLLNKSSESKKIIFKASSDSDDTDFGVLHLSNSILVIAR